jgi:hypothetical protein
MYEPNSEILEMAVGAAERLIGFYPTITASDPKVYAAGLVKLFSNYPEHLVAEALDPVNGLPGECDYLPTIAKVKAFLEPRRRNFERMQDLRERAGRKRLPEPPRDPEQDKRIYEGFKQLSARLAKGHGSGVVQ